MMSSAQTKAHLRGASPARAAARRLHPSRGLAILALAGLAGCDGAPRVLDASTRPLLDMGAVAIRFEIPERGEPTASVLAFRAAYAGIESAAVLGVVDPLSEEAPPLAAGCALRDADVASSNLGSRRLTVELSEMAGVELELGPTTVVRPPTRLYPDLGTAVGGLVNEGAATSVGALPTEIALRTTEGARTTALLGVPVAARLVSITGGPQYITLPGDVEVVTSAPDATVEIRPFGSTGYVSCRVGADGHVNLPGALVGLAAGPSATHLSLDVVRRETRSVFLGGQPTLVQIEVRSSRVVELHR